MEFITDFIPTGKVKSFDDLVREYKEAQNPVAVKTAAVVEPQVKEAGKADEADSSGQLDVEPLHQEGESTTMPKNGPSAKKESVDGVGASPTGADADEADSSGQLDVEPLHQEGESTTLPKNGPAGKKDASEEAGVKEAGIKGNCSDCGKPNFLCKCKKDEESKDEESKDEESEEVKEAQCKKTDKPEEEEEKEAKKDEKIEEEKEASKEKRFVKLSNLDDKQESFLRDYWLQEFDEDYVNAMLANK